MTTRLSLSEAKSHLSEVVRDVRTQGQETIITVDGEPAVRVVPIAGVPRVLTDAEVVTVRVLLGSIERMDRSKTKFDAVALVREGRR